MHDRGRGPNLGNQNMKAKSQARPQRSGAGAFQQAETPPAGRLARHVASGGEKGRHRINLWLPTKLVQLIESVSGAEGISSDEWMRAAISDRVQQLAPDRIERAHAPKLGVGVAERRLAEALGLTPRQAVALRRLAARAPKSYDQVMPFRPASRWQDTGTTPQPKGCAR